MKRRRLMCNRKGCKRIFTTSSTKRRECYVCKPKPKPGTIKKQKKKKLNSGLTEGLSAFPLRTGPTP